MISHNLIASAKEIFAEEASLPFQVCSFAWDELYYFYGVKSGRTLK
jgi:hypothetical protein